MRKIRIVVADDHAVVRMGLVSLLSAQKDMTVVGEAENGQEAVSLAKAEHPDIVIMDIVMPKVDGAAATAKIRAQEPAAKILVLTSFGTSGKVTEALAAGASGAILKSASNDDLLEAVRAVAAGRPVAADIQCEATDDGSPALLLTPRQMEILNLVSRGLTNSEIAEVVGISFESVKSHVSEILTRIGASTRAEAVLIAARKNLLSDL